METVAVTKIVSPEYLSSSRKWHTTHTCVHNLIFFNMDDLIEEINYITVEINLQHGSGISTYQPTKRNRDFSGYKKKNTVFIGPWKSLNSYVFQ